MDLLEIKKQQVSTYLLDNSSCVIDRIILPTIGLVQNGDGKP